MKTLLTAIKTVLQVDDRLSYIRDDDIFITPDPAYIPNGMKFPAVGIKDGTTERKEGMSKTLSRKMGVSLSIFVSLAKNVEASIMGDAESGQKGVLDIEADIHSILDNNMLTDDMRVISAFCPLSDESATIVVSESEIKQMKILQYEYEFDCIQREGV